MAVLRFLAERGHEVQDVRTALAPGTPDHVVAKYANEIGATVVTFNVKHFKKLIHRRPHPDRDPAIRFRHAGALLLQCEQPQALKRLQSCIDVIEFEFARGDRRADMRVIIEVAFHWLTIHR